MHESHIDVFKLHVIDSNLS